MLPPRSYFRFDAAAVEAERQGLEALGYALPALASRLMEVTDGAVSRRRSPAPARASSSSRGWDRADGRSGSRGERISHPLDHPELRAAALSLARVFDLQHEHAAEMLAPSPDAEGDRPASTSPI